MLRQNEIMQTLDMIDHQHLDIRTITMAGLLRAGSQADSPEDL